jgi:CRISPR-associated protein Csd1
MGWMDRCCRVYDNNRAFIGDMHVSSVPLLPVSHTTQKVNVEVRLRGDGSFASAEVLRSDQMITIIPCTESSSARTSGPVPHPLADKLQYTAGDYVQFGGDAKKSCWKLYIENLETWCESPFSHPKVKAVFQYLLQGHLIADLVQEKVLITDFNGKLMKKWDGEKEDTPAIFKSVTGGNQLDTFVRFTVDGDELSNDPTVWKSFNQYQLFNMNETDYCYVQGKRMLISKLSPYKIRNSGDRAKLISSNDSHNFTYRGRFESPQEALAVGYETTQKAHSALRWLIAKQGVSCGDQTILVWGTENEPIPAPMSDTLTIVSQAKSDLEEDEEVLEDPEQMTETEEIFAGQFNLAIQGYGRKLTPQSRVSVIALDSAVPGRLAIRYYRELSGSRLLANIESWHRTFTWRLDYRKIEKKRELGKKPVYQSVSFVGAPAPVDIVKASYGEKVDDKLKKQAVERLLPCIIDGKNIPRDIMLSAVHRATAAVGLESWERRKVRSIACALIRGYYMRHGMGDLSMRVDENYSDRSYLFGRILACAEQVERYAQYIASHDPTDKRTTNAERLMVPFTMHPARTLKILNEKLRPYLERIRANKGEEPRRYKLMLELISRINEKSYNDEPLSEKYLLGYASQRMDFEEQNKEQDKEKNKKEMETVNPI